MRTGANASEFEQINCEIFVTVCQHACSALNGSGQFSRDAIERQMSHQERDSVRAAYIHKAEFLQERRRMMEWWSDFLEKNKGGYVPPWEFTVF